MEKTAYNMLREGVGVKKVRWIKSAINQASGQGPSKRPHKPGRWSKRA
jgi:hypothetical protein